MESTTKVNLGKSIIVPSVQELSKEPIINIPARYVRDDQEDPLIVSHDSSLPSVPVIDLERLDVEDCMNSELDRLHSACKDWGFFQVVNHGVSASLLDEIRTQIESFFKLPYEEKKKLWQQPNHQEGFGQLFVVSDEQKLDCSMKLKASRSGRKEGRWVPVKPLKNAFIINIGDIMEVLEAVVLGKRTTRLLFWKI
ncbi:hypothetical protein SO802_006625 [Lithocarpus litseifolius]|uniref:Non-haem dioxygenase N-terminal domain-containing protein n=1 Tax=Lithocarpus litseifolius TaxID=425828 RepID=A0AAW2DLV2_9ROSI